MKTRIIPANVLFWILLPAALLPHQGLWAAGGNMGGGNGRAETPYLIEDFTDFMTFASPANAAIYWAAGAHARLETNLDMDPNLPGRQIHETAVIAPDANPLDGNFQGHRFAGTFNGNHYRLTNLTINTQGAEKMYLGLFGYIDPAGRVENLFLENTHIVCTTTNEFVGGLCGENAGAIYACTTTFTTIVSHNGDSIGGMCGRNSGVIVNCLAAETVIYGDQSRYLGGLCGTNNNSGDIATSFANTAVINGPNNIYLGGLCGANAGAINNCCAVEAIIGEDGSNAIGGLCGWNHYGIIDNCYAVGVVSGDNLVGGLYGYQNISEPLITDSFWDVEIAGPEPPIGDSSQTSATGKTTAEMLDQNTYTAAGWDFTQTDGDPAVWIMRDGYGYPLPAWKGFTPGDVAGDYNVNLADYAVFAAAWQTSLGDPAYNPACNLDSSPPSDNRIDLADWIVFCQHWLEEN